ncbi:CGNR zinc finger domain-containing protein [Mycobacterium sp. CBMA293]|uniref:CGNR zinc finger domain-containing protein n=1 Tax=unclassified Mycolicibacterium TaxID=2636767 RepID=UPI0012DCEC83|nr:MULTISPECIES: CGNR zinc finger domain-containing protein [unclassified Mycolicibacterium]MUL48538.1 CGNR zinc finger domain-containing protein [Mycolicibacterium sp. CBMA 360]MUL61995.1 CGNR zinc finger domain-containing protein [Mycolicibacterium sp. CBMA 335]MUL73270.1 CGNR zinc finger domain-containing protein [Mycolicibacterium sp. CBMA 311]MUL96439.1 CGNR zinc finger domain-containing protein [Mycolicibacterium sp. CBMA 230]MUM05334.1 RNA-binding protein [Mycolicibacterium sp. CBMA 213
MNFSHDTELTLRAACVLINSDRVDGDQLADRAALDEYLSDFGWTGRRDRDAAELASVHGLRERVGGLWAAADDEESVVGQVNAMLTDTRASPWLTRHPENPEWHLHLASDRDPLAQRMGAEMAMAFADLIRAGELRRLKTCAAPDCTAVLIDLSRNRSRIFCDTGNCGNRQHVAAYRERRAKER